MKTRVLGVRSFPRKPKNYIMVVNADNVENEKIVTYGVNPRDVWVSSDVVPLADAVGYIGKDVNFSFGFNGRVEGISE